MPLINLLHNLINEQKTETELKVQLLVKNKRLLIWPVRYVILLTVNERTKKGLTCPALPLIHFYSFITKITQV